MTRPRPTRKGLRRAAWVVGSVVVLALALAAYVQVAPLPRYATAPASSERVASTPSRVARGRAIFEVRCAACHVDPSTGRASGRPMDDIPAIMAVSHAANITADPRAGIGAWTDGELEHALRTGVARDGRLLPPWMPRLSRMADEDLDSLIAFLRTDDPSLEPSSAPSRGTQWGFVGKALLLWSWRPAPRRGRVVAPPIDDRVAYGRYLVRDLAACWTCHSGDFRGLNREEPERTEGYLAGGTELRDAAGSLVVSSNITPDAETGIGRWSEADLVRALKDGVRPDGRRLRYPMPQYDGFDDAELSAAFAYLQTVPAIRSSVGEEPEPPRERSGRELYEWYGCRSCHGDDGVGIADLRQATQSFPTDEALEAWIRNPSRIRPGSRMPGFDGLIRDDEYPALIRYVRELGERAQR